MQSVRDQVAWGVAMKVFMDKGGTAENQDKTYGPWSCFLDGWMEGGPSAPTNISVAMPSLCFL